MLNKAKGVEDLLAIKSIQSKIIAGNRPENKDVPKMREMGQDMQMLEKAKGEVVSQALKAMKAKIIAGNRPENNHVPKMREMGNFSIKLHPAEKFEEEKNIDAAIKAPVVEQRVK